MANLNANPAIAAYYFQKRWEIFYEEVVKPQLDVVDYWWRFEWQHRGSSHIHGFLWLRNAPPVEDLKLDDNQSVQQFVTFWNHLVSTWNPQPNHPPAPIHPSSRPFTTLSDTQQELVELINRVQQHAKCSSYCLRRDKTTREEVCRFRFPQDLRDLTELVQKEGEALPEFLTKRNDPYLNSYNPTWILGWRANMDFRPVLSPHAAIAYISKYVSKAETQSKSYQDILRTVVGQANDNARAVIVYKKMLSSLVGEQDISGEYLINSSSIAANIPSAQEVCHALFGCPMWVSSRQYRSLKVSEGSSDEVVFGVRPNTVSLYQRYTIRPHTLDNLSLYEFYQWYDVKGDQYRKRGARGGKPYVVDVWPRFVGNPADAETYERFCRAKVFLHHPHRSFDNLLPDSGIQDWPTFYQHCRETCHPHHQDNPDPLPEAIEEEPESDTESIEGSDDDELFQDAWMAEAGRAPNAPVGGNINHLGRRDIDEQHPWTQSDWTEEEIAIACDWMDTQKRSGAAPVNQPPGVDWRLLQGEQRDVFLQVIAWYKAILGAGQGRNAHPQPLRINIDGTAGTGKSFLISAISTEMLNLASQDNKPNPVIRIAPTGIAAFGINGMTAHSALSLPVKSSFNPLIPSALAKFQQQWKEIKLLIIDEKSMIGRTMAGMMDSRLRQIVTDEVMGGVGVLLFGDFAQLPPVGDSPLYSSKVPRKPLQISGRDAYLSFNQSITLQQIFRQQGNDPVSQQFRDLLLRQRTYSITQEDYNLLSTRFSHNVPDEEKRTFSDVIHLFPTRADVEVHNHHYLESTHSPVLRCQARHNGGSHAKKATEDQAEGLEAELLLAVGARVMLTRNIWTDRGMFFPPHH
jgi:ATP-dependent DNA helicase PIF1